MRLDVDVKEDHDISVMMIASHDMTKYSNNNCWLPPFDFPYFLSKMEYGHNHYIITFIMLKIRQVSLWRHPMDGTGPPGGYLAGTWILIMCRMMKWLYELWPV